MSKRKMKILDVLMSSISGYILMCLGVMLIFVVTYPFVAFMMWDLDVYTILLEPPMYRLVLGMGFIGAIVGAIYGVKKNV